MKNKFLYFILIILFALVIIFILIISFQSKKDLGIIFLDVEQGDAILITQGKNQVLIDGGPSQEVLMEKLGRIVPFWDREIEVVIATHPDQDHIRGLLGVLENYNIGVLIDSGAQSRSEVFSQYEKIKKERNIKNIKGTAGTSLKFNQVEINLISPLGENISSDSNENSLVSKLTFGENKFLFTGDIPQRQEEKLVTSGTDLKAQVLKVSHHGSKNSSSEVFLEKVKPLHAVISVGKKNNYGHPASEVLEKLRKMGIKIFRTDMLRDIVYKCSGIDQTCVLEK